jgi:sirohydrochlorin cobaltochelatase
MTNQKTVIVLAMHGVPPADFPRPELTEFMRLHTMLEHGSVGDDHLQMRRDALEVKLRSWRRTAANDPYWAASRELARELKKVTGHRVVVGFNEFCAPSLDYALDAAAAERAARVVIVTPMMTQGGEHSEKDIPGAVERAGVRHPEVEFVYAWPFPVPDVARFLAEQVARSLVGRSPGRA